MAKGRDYKQPTRAELQAMRESKLQGATASEAVRREISFLRNIGGAGDDLEWILFNQAWTELGFERIGDWWEQRVLPVLVHVDLRPSAALAERVIAAIAADEAGLPKAQRRTQREIASIARTSQAKVSRSRHDASESGSDLEGRRKPAAKDAPEPPANDPLDEFPAVIDAVNKRINKTAADAANAPADETSNEAGGMSAGDVSAAGPDVTYGHSGPAVNPNDITDEEPAAPNRSDSSTPPQEGVPAGGDETGPEAHPAGSDSGPVLEQPEQDGTGVDRPAPAPSDPAALLDWFADMWAQVDADVSGPLLTDDDMQMISESLNRIVFVVDLLIKWRDRAQP